MARTKASVVGKVFSGKSSAKASKTQPPKASSSKKSSSGSTYGSGGNPYFPRETPDWQKPITNFFCEVPVKPDADGQVPTSSNADTPKRKRKTMTISSDTESDCEDSKTKETVDLNETDANGNSNTFLNDTNVSDRLNNSDTNLLPLSDDESSHKIGEYFCIDSSAKNSTSKKCELGCKSNGDAITENSFDKNDSNIEFDDVIKVKLGTFKNKGKGKGKGKKTVVNVNTDSEDIEKLNETENTVIHVGTEKENLKPLNGNENVKVVNVNKVDIGKKHELDEIIAENLPKKVKIDV